MTFHVRLTLSDVNPKPSRSVIAIGETILIKGQNEAPQILTSGIQRAYKEISYQLADEEEEEKEDQNMNDGGKSQSSEDDSVNMGRHVDANQIKSTRLRSKNFEVKKEQESRQKSQSELQDRKVEELRKRWDRGEIQSGTKKEKVKKMEDIQAYTNERQFPKDLKPGLIYVDKVHNTVLVPYNAQGVFVPFHVSTIKTVSTKTEGQWTFLRLNFHIPGGSSLQFPSSNDPNALFVKELTLKNQSHKSGAENHLTIASKDIKDLIKKVKDQEAADAAQLSKNAGSATAEGSVEDI